MKIVLGTMTINYDYVSSDNSIHDHTKIIQSYIDSVNDPILDTAYYYGNTQTEKTLGKIIPNLQEELNRFFLVIIILLLYINLHLKK